MRISDWSSDVCSSDLMQIEALGEKAPGTDEGATGETPSAATPMQMDMWVDAQDRPVSVETAVSSQGKRLTTRLYYGLSGEPGTTGGPQADTQSAAEGKSVLVR